MIVDVGNIDSVKSLKVLALQTRKTEYKIQHIMYDTEAITRFCVGFNWVDCCGLTPNKAKLFCDVLKSFMLFEFYQDVENNKKIQTLKE